jgi:GT2 family glycosyltransferase
VRKIPIQWALVRLYIRNKHNNIKKMANAKYKYSVAIRTLGKAGIAYETLIHCLKAQTIQPQKIVVYLAEGYTPPQQVADEKIVYCKKGMAHQRAMKFEEIDAEYILLCDDDVYFPEDSVEKLFIALDEHNADCISANVFPNQDMRFRMKVVKAMLYGELPSFSNKFAFRIRKSSNYSYCNAPNDVMESQSCAGPCMLVKKSVNNSLNYEDELWLDQFPYTSGQDQIFAYKLYRYGYKLCIHYATGIIHLDARTGHIKDEIQADFNKRKIRYIEWYRSIYEPSRNYSEKISAIFSYYLYWFWLFGLSVFSFITRRNKFKIRNSINALVEARKYVKSSEYSCISKWNVSR